jgi:hypothetical protein
MAPERVAEAPLVPLLLPLLPLLPPQQPTASIMNNARIQFNLKC